MVKPASEFEVELNGYIIDTRALPTDICHYRIAFTKVTEKKQRDLTRGQKQDFAVQLRRRVCMSLFNTLMKKNEQLFPKSEKFAFIYDCGNSLYTKRQLPIEAGDGILRLELLPVGVICCVS
ncbi:unnamed protein product [Heligmosomoides polygyrus]|uniref:Uncharacterized protein n=1 Tax=Heligmosomoides polygyrus TaxID=6339 RepID=A0A183F8M0_HELPZ|nr:unnamed protein product [Heligmosomoides polygyrus]